MPWSLVDPDHTLASAFDDGCAIFNPVRWETHVVDPVVGDLIQTLLDESLTAAELTDRVKSAGLLDADHAGAFVLDALDQLQDLGLVFEIDADRRAHG